MPNLFVAKHATSAQEITVQTGMTAALSLCILGDDM